MNSVPLSRTVPRAIAFRWWQPNRTAPVDCTGFTATIGETTLPFALAVSAIDLAQGRFEIAAPTPEQAAKLRLGKSYGIQIILRNALGHAAYDARFLIEIV